MEHNTRQTLFDLIRLDNRSSIPILSKIITKNDTSLRYAQEKYQGSCNNILQLHIRHFMLMGYYALLPYIPSKQHQLLIDILSQHLLVLDMQRYRHKNLIRYFDHSIQSKNINPLPEFINTHKMSTIKSRIGLSYYLSTYYRLPITVTKNRPTWQPIKNPHTNQLGLTSYLGKTHYCAEGNLVLLLNPVSYKQYKKIINNKNLLKQLQQHSQSILCNKDKPIIKIIIKSQTIPRYRLGIKKQKLGVNIFLRFHPLTTKPFVNVQFYQTAHND